MKSQTTVSAEPSMLGTSTILGKILRGEHLEWIYYTIYSIILGFVYS